MILSLAHKFLFVRGLKVGGTSVEIALSTICGPEDIVSALIPVDERRRQALNGRCGNYSDSPASEALYTRLVRESPQETLHLLQKPQGKYSAHSPLSKIVERYPGSLEGFQAVCMVRDPYARVLSALNMLGGFDAYRHGGPLLGELSAWPSVFDEMFDDRRLHALRLIDQYWDTACGLPLRPIRYEHLQSDFIDFVASIGLSQAVALPHAKKGMMSNELNPLQILRADQISKINTVFAAEFTTFGYARL